MRQYLRIALMSDLKPVPSFSYLSFRLHVDAFQSSAARKKAATLRAKYRRYLCSIYLRSRRDLCDVPYHFDYFLKETRELRERNLKTIRIISQTATDRSTETSSLLYRKPARMNSRKVKYEAVYRDLPLFNDNMLLSKL